MRDGLSELQRDDTGRQQVLRPMRVSCADALHLVWNAQSIESKVLLRMRHQADQRSVR